MRGTLFITVTAIALTVSVTAAHAASGPPTIFLNRAGGRVFASHADDSARNLSAVVADSGLRMHDVPAFAGGDAAWRAMTRCVRGHFEPFGFRIVDERPRSGDYIMVMVGGRSRAMDLQADGVAGYADKAHRRAIVFVFSDTMGNDQNELCLTAAHEVGHVLGLDHSQNCKDIMSNDVCGAKSFTRRPARCGDPDEDPRDCASGSRRQSSFGTLAKLGGKAPVGPLATTMPNPDAGGDDEDADDADQSDDGDWDDEDHDGDWDDGDDEDDEDEDVGWVEVAIGVLLLLLD